MTEYIPLPIREFSKKTSKYRKELAGSIRQERKQYFENMDCLKKDYFQLDGKLQKYETLKENVNSNINQLKEESKNLSWYRFKKRKSLEDDIWDLEEDSLSENSLMSLDLEIKIAKANQKYLQSRINAKSELPEKLLKRIQIFYEGEKSCWLDGVLKKKKISLLKKLEQGNELNITEAQKIGKIENKNNLPFKYLIKENYNNFIGSGFAGVIYEVSNDKKSLAVKFPNDEWRAKNLRSGSKVQSLAYKKGIQCPKPEGMFNVFDGFEWKEGFVMKKIRAISEKNLEEVEKTKIKVKLSRELERAKINGFLPFQDAIRNYVVGENKEIYLVDFDEWKVESKN